MPRAILECMNGLGENVQCGHSSTRTVLIAGDIFPTERALPLLVGGASVDVLGFLRDAIELADVSVANLECPLTDAEGPIKKTGPSLRGAIRGAQGIRDVGFDIVTLANNHLRDYGESGVVSTLGACADAGIKVVGAGLDLEDAQRPLVFDADGLRIGLIAACENEFSVATDRRAGANPIDPLELSSQISQNRNRWDALVILLHAGREHYPYPTPRQRALCRWLVGLGAAAVVCQHSHCAGCYEQVGSSLIVYGQGNFIFDPPGRVPATWFNGFTVSMKLGRGEVRSFELLPFQQPFHGDSEVGSSFERADWVLEQVIRRSDEIQMAGFVENKWREHCAEVSSAYKFWLTGSRWHDRFLFRLSRLLRRPFNPFTNDVQRRYSLLLRCDTHREILETILSESGDSNIEEPRK